MTSNLVNSRDINLFPIGAIVDVVGVPEYQFVTISRISDSGVTVSGEGCGKNMIISGRSPAILTRGKNKIEKETSNSEASTSLVKVYTQEKTVQPENNKPLPGFVKTPKRGSFVAKMDALKIPAEPFTIKQLVELNDIPQPYANAWVNKNCVKVGEAPKKEGQRGRAAATFALDN